MSKYRVTVERILHKEIVVEATSVEEAEELAIEQADAEGWDSFLDNGRTDTGSVTMVRTERQPR